MSVIDDLLASTHLLHPDSLVQEVILGPYWTAVRSKNIGLAATLQGTSEKSSEDITNAGHLHEMTAYQLAEYLRSPCQLEASVGMAG